MRLSGNAFGLIFRGDDSLTGYGANRKMKQLEYLVVDVFTNQRFSGNPLAVFPDADGITLEQMQKIAAEFNLSETVFVVDSDKAERALRIFTPHEELPLAGHPVVGAWKVLADLGVVEHSNENQTVRLEQELVAGILPVEIDFENGSCTSVRMKQANFERSHTLESEEVRRLADALGLSRSSIGNSSISHCDVVSTGVKSLAVPVHSQEDLNNISVDSVSLGKCYSKYGATGVYAFCFETLEAKNKVSARFFAPTHGISEDAATGSAAGALGGNLVSRGALDAGDFVIEQGDKMGRPSRIRVRVEGFDDVVTSVFVSGTAVNVMKGQMFLD